MSRKKNIKYAILIITYYVRPKGTDTHMVFYAALKIATHRILWLCVVPRVQKKILGKSTTY